MTNRPRSRPAALLPPTVALLLATGALADAQQVLEIDFEAGRTIIDDEWRAMSSYLAAVDWERGVLYVRDDEEPEGIMAFSLETGEWVRTIPTPKGDGPHEFAQGVTDIAISPGGGLYMTGFVRVVGFDPEGVPIDSWRPEVPVPRRVCSLGGVPAVPTQGGVVRRGPDNTSVAIGPVRAQGRSVAPEAEYDAAAIWDRLRTAHVVCSEDRAYVRMSYAEGQPDSLFVYHLGGEAEALAVPVEDASGRRLCIRAEERRADGSLIRPERPCPHWSRGARLSFDDRGNIVLLGNDTDTHGALINPETGCYALIRSTREHPHEPIAIHADSVLVLRRPFEISRRGDETIISVDDSGEGLSLHPLRRVSGEGCEGLRIPGG